MNVPKVVAIVLTCNQKDLTLACLDSLHACSYSNLTIIVVDNNSQDNTETAVRHSFPDVHYIRNDKNAGVAGGRNTGIFYAEQRIAYEYLLIIDNDTTVQEGFLDHMVEVLENDTRIGIAAPKIYLMDETDILDQAGGSVVNFFTGSTAKRGFGEIDTGQYDKIDTQKCLPPGACSLSRRSAVQACSGLDEIFNPYGFEDLDYALRAKKKGFRLAYCPEAVIYHKGNKTGFSSYTESYAAIKGKHLRTFMMRHASLFQLICFHLLLPLLGIRSFWREARRGNAMAVIRLLQAYLKKGNS